MSGTKLGKHFIFINLKYLNTMRTVRFLVIATIVMFIANQCQAQSDSSRIVKLVDEMTDKSYFNPTANIPIISEDNQKGFGLSLNLKEVNGEIVQDGLSVMMINIGSCVENVELIIMFADSTKMSLTSWNKFNCEGDAWYNLTDKQFKKLSETKIIKLKVINGRTYDSLSGDVPENADEYFINLNKRMKAKIYTVKKE